MSRLGDLVNATLSEGRPAGPIEHRPGAPRPVALWQEVDRGVVLLLIERTDGSLHRLLAFANRLEDGSWDVGPEIQMPWAKKNWQPTKEIGLQILGESGTTDLIALSGIAAPEIAEVQARRGSDRATARVDDETRVFLVVLPASGQRSVVELVGVDPAGVIVATSEVLVEQLP